MKIALKGPLKYVQQPGIADELGNYAFALGTKALVVVSAGNRKRMGAQLQLSLENGGCQCVFAELCGEVTVEEVVRIADISITENCNVIIGAGGGRVLDAARAAADIADKKLIIFPTAAANDAPCSAVAVLHDESGKVVEIREVRRNPDLVLVDTDIIAKAPVRFLSAGMGDALSTWFEARACSRSGAKTHAGGGCGKTALTLAKLCYDTLLESGAAAMDAIERGEINDALEEVIHATIYLSGMGFENGGVAACHAVNDGFLAISESSHLLHGELVGFGVLVLLELEQASREEKNIIHDFMHRIALPMTLEQLGLSDIAANRLRKVAEEACSVPLMKNMPFPVDPDSVFYAILNADTASSNYLKRLKLSAEN